MKKKLDVNINNRYTRKKTCLQNIVTKKIIRLSWYWRLLTIRGISTMLLEDVSKREFIYHCPTVSTEL